MATSAVRIVTQNHALTASFTASSIAAVASTEVPFTPAYLGDGRGGRVFRTVSDSGEYLQANFSTAKTVSVAALIGHNLSGTGASIWIVGSVTSNFFTISQCQAWAVSVPFSPVIALYLDTPHSARYWRAYINDSPNTDNFLEVGEWVLGQYVALDWNPSFPLTEQRRGINTAGESEGTAEWSRHVTLQTDFEVQFNMLNSLTRSQLNTAIEDMKGGNVPFLIHFNPSTTSDPLHWVRLKNAMKFQRKSGSLYSMDNIMLTEESQPIRF